MPGQKRVFALDVPGIHLLAASSEEDVDGRDKPGHDGDMGQPEAIDAHAPSGSA
jgi:hypothetical protein